MQVLGDEESRTPHLRPEHHGYDDVTSFCLIFETQIDWTGFGLWLSMLLNRHGANILRVKGILNIAQASYPVAVHGVQHMVHPPVHLNEWPDDDRRSRLVFIVRGFERQRNVRADRDDAGAVVERPGEAKEALGRALHSAGRRGERVGDVHRAVLHEFVAGGRLPHVALAG